MGIVRIAALKDFRTNALSTTDVSTGFQLGAATTGQKIYAALHLTCAAASTSRVLSMAVQSATASGFGSPATRITFTLTSSEDGQWGTPLGGLSTEHTWWRASWTMSTAASTSNTWKGLVTAGIR